MHGKELGVEYLCEALGEPRSSWYRSQKSALETHLNVFADFDPKIPEYPMLIYDIISIMA